MATIQSLPTELIRHTLSLAHPPGTPGSGRGLCSTALVQKSWTQPSASVMTERLIFDDRKWPSSIGAFINSGPVGFSSRSVELTGCSNLEILGVLSRAEPGGITGLTIRHPFEAAPDSLFTLESLTGLRQFGLVLVDMAEPQLIDRDGNQVTVFVVLPIRFAPWPGNLQHLTLHARSLQPELITGSLATLKTLKLEAVDSQGSRDLLEHASQAVSLETFELGRFEPSQSFAVPLHFASFIGALPVLTSLRLFRLNPHMLEHILGAIPATQPLRHLTTNLYALDPEFGLVADDSNAEGAAEVVKWTTDWMPGLRRCAGMAVVRGLKSWAVGVVWTDLNPDVKLREEQELASDEIDELDNSLEGWLAFRKAVEKTGVELVLGPFED